MHIGATMNPSPPNPEEFVQNNTAIAAPSLVPELRLHLATEVTPLWQATEQTLEEEGLPPPYWAFAWPGSQALARHILDHPQRVCGRRVFDFGAGCGLAAIAAAHAGAAEVTANDIDPFSLAAIRLNAALNGVVVTTAAGNRLHGPPPAADIILCGDVCYEQPMATATMAWLGGAVRNGIEVWLADPGRAFLPATGLRLQAEYLVPTNRDLEDREIRATRIFYLVQEPAPVIA